MTSQPPPFPDITDDVLHRIAEQHHLNVDGFKAMPQVGMVHKLYLMGEDLVIRFGRAHPRSIEIAEREALAVSVARGAGVRTPDLLVCDVSLELIPAAFTVYERIHGDTLGLLNLEPDETPAVWRELGRDLARLHAGSYEEDLTEQIQHDHLPDPRAWPEQLAAAGYFTISEANWFSQWLDHLAPYASAPVRQSVTHGDTQATNIMIEPTTGSYLALIDWSNANWGDPTYDFGDSPIRTVPYVLDGYRQIRPLDNDETAEARILWRHLQLALNNMWSEPQPARSWAERPLSFLIDIMRFLLETQDKRWKDLIIAAGR